MNYFKCEKLDFYESDDYKILIPCVKITQLINKEIHERYYFCSEFIFLIISHIQIYFTEIYDLKIDELDELYIKDVILCASVNYCPDEVIFGKIHDNWLKAWKKLIEYGVVKMKKQWKCLEEKPQ